MTLKLSGITNPAVNMWYVDTVGVNSMSLTGYKPSECEHTLSISKVLILCNLFGCTINIKRNLSASPYSINNKVSKCNEWSIFLIKMFVCSFSVISKHEAQYVNNVIYFDLFDFCIKKEKKNF